MAAVHHRWACAKCDVLLNVPYQPVCEFCGDPMIPGHTYQNPCSTGWASPMLAHLDNQEQP